MTMAQIDRDFPALEELSPYLRPGLSCSLLHGAVRASIQKVMNDEADEDMVVDIVDAAFDGSNRYNRQPGPTGHV